MEVLVAARAGEAVEAVGGLARARPAGTPICAASSSIVGAVYAAPSSRQAFGIGVPGKCPR